MTFVNNDFRNVVLGRQSVRRFVIDTVISREEIMQMLEETIQTPSACNLQSWKFVVVDTPEAKNKVKEVTMPFNYPQLETAPITIFVVGDTHSHKVYRKVWTQYCEEGRISPERLEQVFSSFLPLYEKGSREFLIKDATLDASMAAMQFLLIARAHGYEACAWAGYDFKGILPALNLDVERYVPIMAISIGKSDETPVDSSRYPVETVVEFLA